MFGVFYTIKSNLCDHKMHRNFLKILPIDLYIFLRGTTDVHITYINLEYCDIWQAILDVNVLVRKHSLGVLITCIFLSAEALTHNPFWSTAAAAIYQDSSAQILRRARYSRSSTSFAVFAFIWVHEKFRLTTGWKTLSYWARTHTPSTLTFLQINKSAWHDLFISH